MTWFSSLAKLAAPLFGSVYRRLSFRLGGGGGGVGCLESPGVFQNGVEKIESIIRFSNPDVDIFANVFNRNNITLQGPVV